MIRAKVSNKAELPPIRREVPSWEGKSLHEHDYT